jgi:hypothetical protein
VDTRDIAVVEFLDLVHPVALRMPRREESLARANRAGPTCGPHGNYVHSRRLAQSDVDVARLSADHLKRDEGRNLPRRNERIEVAGDIFHDGTAEHQQVRATYERHGSCRFPLGGLGLRSHANRGANHRCNRNYSTYCHVVAPWLDPLPAGSQVKQVGSMLRNPKITAEHEVVQLRFVACPLWVASSTGRRNTLS